MIHVSRYDLSGVRQRGRRALLHGTSTVVETATLAAAEALRGRLPDSASLIWEWLPSEFSNRYTADFFMAFAASAVIVGWKLTDPDTIYPLASVTEELALHAIFRVARLEVGRGAGSPHRALEDLLDDLVEDEDFLFLFDPAMLDIQDQPALQAAVPTANLRFTDWCKPFNPARHVAPFVCPDEQRWAACWTRRPDWWDSREGNDDPDDDRVRPALVQPALYRRCRDCELLVAPQPGTAGATGFLHLTTGRSDHPAWPSDEDARPLHAWLGGASAGRTAKR